MVSNILVYKKIVIFFVKYTQHADIALSIVVLVVNNSNARSRECKTILIVYCSLQIVFN